MKQLQSLADAQSEEKQTEKKKKVYDLFINLGNKEYLLSTLYAGRAERQENTGMWQQWYL